MKKNVYKILILCLALLWVVYTHGAAQAEDGLRLRLSKIVGYSSLSANEIQGSMNLTASGPENLQRVVFLIDGATLSEATQAPFKAKFNTGDYPLGIHTLSAVGYTSDGSELRSNGIRTNFVTAEQGWQAAMKIAGPLLAIVFGVTLISLVVPLVFNRGKKVVLLAGTPRKYGIFGGAICPRCGRPFALHSLINLGPTLKLDFCPYCGKFGVMRRRSLADLRAAEAAELERAAGEAGGAGQVQGLSEEEKLRKELEDSRYQS